MRSALVLAVGAAAVALIAGCGQAHPGAAAGGMAAAGGSAAAPRGSAAAPRASAGTPAVAPSAVAQASAAPSRAAACHAGVVVIRTSDNYRRLCVRRGATVLVYLTGTATSRWSLIHASSGVLRPRASGHLSLMRGVTGASFLAVRPGSATLTAIRQVFCGPSAPPGNAAPESGTLECDTILGFQVTVTVT